MITNKIDYESEESDPKNETNAQEKEEKGISNKDMQKWSHLAKGFLDSGLCTIKCMIRSNIHMQHMYLRLRFRCEEAHLLIRKQALEPFRLKVLTNKNVDHICKVLRKQGKKNANDNHTEGNRFQSWPRRT